jgi:hypothetical protein
MFHLHKYTWDGLLLLFKQPKHVFRIHFLSESLTSVGRQSVFIGNCTSQWSSGCCDKFDWFDLKFVLRCNQWRDEMWYFVQAVNFAFRVNKEYSVLFVCDVVRSVSSFQKLRTKLLLLSWQQKKYYLAIRKIISIVTTLTASKSKE